MTANLQDLFDQAGRNPPTLALDADAVMRRARRSRNRRISALAATVAVILAVGAGLASQQLLSAAPIPAAPLPTPPQPTAPAPGSLGRLAYELDGDIYLANSNGTNPVRIADGAAGKESCAGYWGEGPLWSPDGRYLAYRGTGGDGLSEKCDRTVNISDANGHRVASFPGDGWAIAWSPDSTRVAAWIDLYGEHTLGIYGLDGQRQTVLTVPPEVMPSGDIDPTWAPDGQSLLLPNGILIPLDGSPPRALPVECHRAYFWNAYSPDGSQFACITEDGLAVSTVDGSQARLLIPEETWTSLAWWPGGLAWSPTGDRIVFAFGADEESPDPGDPPELRVVDVASGAVTTLADVRGMNIFGNLKFSPEGDQILFTRTDADSVPSLWSVRADGSHPRRLVEGTSWGDWQKLTPTG